jgi:hypothetical protein
MKKVALQVFLLDCYFGDTGFFLYTLSECDCF